VGRAQSWPNIVKGSPKLSHVRCDELRKSNVASLVPKRANEMDESAKDEDKPGKEMDPYADPNVQKFLTLLAEIIVHLTLQDYEQQKRHRVPPDQPGASK
jgi:hypothetical protein